MIKIKKSLFLNISYAIYITTAKTMKNDNNR
jgi:hypothetical protein